jgi:hypothetical protein
MRGDGVVARNIKVTTTDRSDSGRILLGAMMASFGRPSDRAHRPIYRSHRDGKQLRQLRFAALGRRGGRPLGSADFLAATNGLSDAAAQAETRAQAGRAGRPTGVENQRMSKMSP